MVKFTQPPRGTRDLVGEEADLFIDLVGKFSEIARLNDFKPIVTPTIEYFDLFAKKSGVEIVQSMYVFQDKAGRTIALRPEVTASVIRAYLRNLYKEPKPINLFYIAQCFRYDEPQRGRYREFWQLGLEIIGDESMAADINILHTASEYLTYIGVKHLVQVGNVAFYRSFMDSMGVSGDDQDLVLHYIDKGLLNNAEKLVFEKYGEEASKILRELYYVDIERLSEFINDYRNLLGDRCSKIAQEAEKTLSFTDALRSIGINVEYSPSLVRGLAYYTGLIYEVKAEGLDLSVGGGGRYDGLTEIYGGSFEYSTGIALGLDRIMIVLKEKGYVVKTPLRVIIIALGSSTEIYRAAINASRALHSSGIIASVLSEPRVSKALSYASRKGYLYAIIIGKKEIETQSVTIKDLTKGEQTSLHVSGLVKYFKDALSS
ncbi:MAG: histidine--tRNA ligase [Sulfolobales archaeon]|nr:histidine--tRNA ligase [Sulfolobales archaeon]MCX8198546.1 histidine--tRNA ligase [Sulfolobales archaeon]MDW8169619.1 histidine--tRNA ligase [Desulfurococcaceae archaeon]